MHNYDIIIIGGGPAGFATALSARNTYPSKRVAILRKEDRSVIPCGIPYTMRRLAAVEDDIMPDLPLEKAGIEIVIGEAVSRDGSTLRLVDGRTIEFERLVIAAGSTPVVPPVPGVDKKGIFSVGKSLTSLQAIKDAALKAQHIVIVGGGYVGVEFADELCGEGHTVTIVDQCDHLLPLSMDVEFLELLEEETVSRGTQLRLGQAVARFDGADAVSAVRLEDGSEIAADMVLLTVGYKPDHGFAERLGVEVGKDRRIVVDEYMRTSVPGIFAAGDCAEGRHFLTGERWPIMLASTAMAQGRLAGSNLYTIKAVKPFHGVLGTFSTKIGRRAFGVSGLTERQAKDLGLDYIVGRATVPDRHPGKLPDASMITIKLIFARHSHLLLGGQLCGGDSTGELANLLAVMIQKEMTDMEIDTLQIGTHPLLTSSPIAYPVITAAVDAISKWYGDGSSLSA